MTTQTKTNDDAAPARPPEPRSISVRLKIVCLLEGYHDDHTLTIDENQFYQHLAAQMGSESSDVQEYSRRAFENLVKSNLGLTER